MRKRRPVSGGAVLEFEITIGTRKENQLLCYKAIFQLSSLCDLVLQNVLNSAIIQGRYLLDVLQTGLIIQKTGDKVTGDQLECVFAHLKNGDSRMNVKDSHGIPMGNHLETLYDPRTDTYYLRFIPTLLTPTMCFYSFDATKVAAMNDGKMPIFPHVVSFLPDRYLDEMCYEKDTASFLFINDPKKFFEELKEQVPIAIKQNASILTADRYYRTKGNDDCELFVDKVDYTRHLPTDIYYDEPRPSAELFWKYPQYHFQSEVRVAILNTNFVWDYDPQHFKYEQHRLDVYLPHLHEYATIRAAKDLQNIYFFCRSEDEPVMCAVNLPYQEEK